MSEEIFFRSIYDHIGVPILVVRVDASGDFVFDSLNPACEKATGLRNEEAAGKRPEAISGLSRASAAALRANLPALPGGQCCHPLPGAVRRSGPRESGGLTQLAPARGCIQGRSSALYGTLIHVQELEGAGVALRESEEKYRLLVEQSLFRHHDRARRTADVRE